MILHCRDFTVDEFDLTMGHNRETGKRYFIQEVNEKTLFDIPAYLTSTPAMVEQLESIFWIKGE